MNTKIGVKVFTLPIEEQMLNNFINQDNIDIVNKVITPLPKQEVILYLIEFEELIE